jgi:hypothetical protein
MQENVFTFGDMIFKQRNGTAMGTPPACALATIYFAIIGENEAMQQFDNHNIYLKRFIDDLFGIWKCHPDPNTDTALYQQFIAKLNECPGLAWIANPLSTTVDFLDITIELQEDRFQTTLYKKDLKLFLYIRSTSLHPPSLLSGIVYGTLFCIQTLCTEEKDRSKRTKTFFKRLIARGYQPHELKPLFEKAIQRAQEYTGPPEIIKQTRRKALFFHVKYHPKDPPSHSIQQAWKNYVANPPYSMPLENICNPKTKQPLQISRLIVAYSRAMNLGNLLTHRNLPAEHDGRHISSFYEPYGII